MASHDHQLKIGSTTKNLDLIMGDDGNKMYMVDEQVPQYQDPLLITQTDWKGGHGQHDADMPDSYFEGQSIDTTQPGRLFLGPLINTVLESDASNLDSAVVCFMWFAATSELLCATAGKIYRYDVGSDGEWTLASTTVAGVTSMVEFNGIAYAGVGSSTKYWYSADGDTWTQTDLTDGYALGFFVSSNAASTSNVLWKWKNPNEIASTSDGRTVAGGGSQWTTPAYIGDTSANVTNIFLSNDDLLIGKTDGLYHYDSNGGVHPKLGDLKHNRDTQNFKYVTDWQSAVYFSLITGMGEIYAQGSYEPMGPITNIDDIGKTGTCVGLSSDRDFLYAAIDEGTNTHIYKGKEVRRNNELRWEWCPWVYLATNACATIKVVQHSSTDRRLWFGYGTATGYVKIFDDPVAESGEFATSGWIRMSYNYGTNQYWDKLVQSVVMEVEGGGTGETVQVKYRKDTDTSATQCVAAAATNGTFRTMFSSALSFNRIQFEIHLASNTTANTPEVKFFQVWGVEKPTTVRTHLCTYKVDSKQFERGDTLRTFLRGGRASTTLIKFADLRFSPSGTGSTDYVWVVMNKTPKEVEIKHTRERLPELGVAVELREVAFTVS